VGLRSHGARRLVAVIGLVPLAAGACDVCVLGPAMGRPFQGEAFRRSTSPRTTSLCPHGRRSDVGPSLRPALPASIVTLVLADLADDRPPADEVRLRYSRLRAAGRLPLTAGPTASPSIRVVLCSAWNAMCSAWNAMWSAWIPVEIGGKYSFTGYFRPFPNTELEAYLAKVRVASSSLVSRSTP
jgi:hypothetical protein